ncbi:MAG: hypothetical protein JKY65_10335 [Planctomycetes bacterium]|nr:hypothetical protein [Planctomycetota bacterium]
MKMDLIKIVGALSIGALALTGCTSDGGGSEQPADAKSAEGDSGCTPSGKSECKSGKSECKAAKSK